MAGLALMAGTPAGPRWQVLPGAARPARTDDTLKYYLPIVSKSYPPPTVCGAEMASLTGPNGLHAALRLDHG